VVKGRSAKTGYSRAAFGAAWIDVDENGCNTRDDVLAATLIGVQQVGCDVVAGTLRDNYTEVTIDINDPAGIDVDHMVALADAWQKGASRWPAAKRIAFANDPLNLQPTLSAVNSAKGASDVASWLPPNRAYRCEFVARIIAVKTKYELWVTQPEAEAMLQVLSRCPNQAVIEPGSQPTVASDAVVAAEAPQPSAPSPRPSVDGPSLDPRFPSCRAATSAGYGNYRNGINPEYDWYRDADGDGIVCEF
jgi:hypothetical protein